jgi:transposase
MRNKCLDSNQQPGSPGQQREDSPVGSRNITVFRRYIFQIYPSEEQKRQLHIQRRMMAQLWNAFLQRHEDIWRRTKGQRGVLHSEDKASYSFFDMTNEVTQLRHECPEWAALSVWSPHRIAKSMDEAFSAFYRRARAGAGARAGYPRYQRSEDGRRIPHVHNPIAIQGVKKSSSGSGCRLEPVSERKRTQNWRLTLKGVSGLIHARGRLPLDNVICKNADVLWRDNKWWFSICVEMPPRREPGTEKLTVELDGLDCLARVAGEPETPEGLLRAHDLTEIIDELKSERDQRWPRRSPRDPDWVEANQEINSLSARSARIRRDALHVWSTRLASRARDLTIITPRVSDHVVSPHGDEKQWGAATDTVSKINRNVLSMAPAAAVAMLTYKAEEAGIRCDIVEDEAPAIAIGSVLVDAGRKLRNTARKIRKANPGSPGQ